MMSMENLAAPFYVGRQGEQEKNLEYGRLVAGFQAALYQSVSWTMPDCA